MLLNKRIQIVSYDKIDNLMWVSILIPRDVMQNMICIVVCSLEVLNTSVCTCTTVDRHTLAMTQNWCF